MSDLKNCVSYVDSIVSNKITNLHNTDDHSNDGNGITGFQKNYDDTGYANTIQEENSEGEPMLRIAGNNMQIILLVEYEL